MITRLEVDHDALMRLSRIVSRISKEDLRFNSQDLPGSTTREEAAMFYTILYSIDYGVGLEEKKRLANALWSILEERGFNHDFLLGLDGNGLNTLLKEYGVKMPRPELRAMLLRDLSRKVEKLYNGSYYAVVVESHGQLRYKNGGFLDRLQDFYAYRSPAYSKAYRLAIQLYRVGALPAHDLWNAGVSVDSALVGLAVRYGLVRISDSLLERIALGTPLDPETDRVLREYVFITYRLVAQEAGVDPFTLDGLLRIIYNRYCNYRSGQPGELAGEDIGCMGLRNPRLWVRDPLPPRDSWWD